MHREMNAGTMPAPAQPLFPISGAPAGGLQPQQQPAHASSAPSPGGSLFPIAQQPAATPVLLPGAPAADLPPAGM